jgi:hypothetical protein
MGALPCVVVRMGDVEEPGRERGRCAPARRCVPARRSRDRRKYLVGWRKSLRVAFLKNGSESWIRDFCCTSRESDGSIELPRRLFQFSSEL